MNRFRSLIVNRACETHHRFANTRNHPSPLATSLAPGTDHRRIPSFNQRVSLSDETTLERDLPMRA